LFCQYAVFSLLFLTIFGPKPDYCVFSNVGRSVIAQYFYSCNFHVFLQVIDPVCHQLFDFYRSLNTELQRFTLELVPTLLWTYVSSPCVGDKKVVYYGLLLLTYY